MLSIGKVRLSGEAYYLAAVADGVDEYYRGVGETPGRWTGSIADELGLEGEVKPDQLHAVWAGQHPETSESLGRFRGRQIAGFDLTFRAPKSVSLLAGLGDSDTARTVTVAHEAAVDAAFGYIERTAARSRTGVGGVNEIEVDGLVAAAFRHRTSRAGDPHLHTHVLVANMGRGPDGVWRTLDGRWLYSHARTAGFLYEAHLRHELTERLGVEWAPVRNGIADVAGIDKAVLEHFSDRRREIVEYLDEVGFSSARAAELAALDTRDAKDTSLDGRSMRQAWEAKAATIGFDPAELAQVIDQVPRRVPEGVPEGVPGVVPVSVPTPGQAHVAYALLGPGGLTAKASTFNRRDVLRGVAERMPAGATVAQIEAMAEEILCHPDVVSLHDPAGRGAIQGTNVIRRTDGRIIASNLDDARWSTVELVRLEQHLTRRATARVGSGVCVVESKLLEAGLERRPTLVTEQAAMVTWLTSSGNGVDVVSAAAGTGKTYTLDAAREVWQSAGYRVLGAAVAGIAAQELEATAGIPSWTIAALSIDLASDCQHLDSKTILVIDEAGMAGTRTLAPLLDDADRAGAKVVLVGDPKQLPEIDAGGLLSGLATRLGAIELVENRRQRSGWERDALAELRAGDIDVALTAYANNGRLVTGTNALEVRRAMVADWWAYQLGGDTTTMTAFRRSDVDDLNGRARAYMIRGGLVHGPELEINQRPFQAGDQIVCLHNDRRLGIRNGTRGTITHVDPEQHSITLQTNRGRVRLPAVYLDAGHLAHGYATTIHKTQGATVDRGLLLGTDELFRERGYVGMSRGRLSNHLYLLGAEPEEVSTGHGPPERGLESVDAVGAALHVQQGQRLAIDTGDPVPGGTVEELVAERHRVADILAACPPDRTHDIASLTARRRETAAQIEPLIARLDHLEQRWLHGPGSRKEIRELNKRLQPLTIGLGRLDDELTQATSDTTGRARFVANHTADIALLDALGRRIDQHIEVRVDEAVINPSAYQLHILGPVPADPEHLPAWRRGATTLERLQLGVERERGIPQLPSSMPARQHAELLARVETIRIPREIDAVQRGLERDLF